MKRQILHVDDFFALGIDVFMFKNKKTICFFPVMESLQSPGIMGG